MDGILFDIGLSYMFLDLSPQVRESKVKTKQKKQIGPNHTKKLLQHLDGNYDAATYKLSGLGKKKTPF